MKRRKWDSKTKARIVLEGLKGRKEECPLAADHWGLDGGVKKNRGRLRMRRPSESVARRNGVVLDRIRDIKSNHPFWGYRRVWPRLRRGMSIVWR